MKKRLQQATAFLLLLTFLLPCTCIRAEEPLSSKLTSTSWHSTDGTRSIAFRTDNTGIMTLQGTGEFAMTWNAVGSLVYYTMTSPFGRVNDVLIYSIVNGQAVLTLSDNSLQFTQTVGSVPSPAPTATATPRVTATPRPTATPKASLVMNELMSFAPTMTNSYMSQINLASSSVRTIYDRGDSTAAAIAVRLLADLSVHAYGQSTAKQMRYHCPGASLSVLYVGHYGEIFVVYSFDPGNPDRLLTIGYMPSMKSAWYAYCPISPATVSACENGMDVLLTTTCNGYRRISSANLQTANNAILPATPRPTNTPKPTSTPKPASSSAATATPRPTNTPKPTPTATPPHTMGARIRVATQYDGRLAFGSSHLVALTNQHIVKSVGKNTLLQLDVANWHKKVVYLEATAEYTLGILENGNVVVTGWCEYDLSGWTDMKALCCAYKGVVGLRENGTVVAAGFTTATRNTVSRWKNVAAIDAQYDAIAAVLTNGTVVSVGLGYNTSSWRNIIDVTIASGYIVGLKADGTVVTAGNSTTKVGNFSTWRNVVAFDSTHGAVIGLRSDGTVLYAGEHREDADRIATWKNVVAIYGSDTWEFAAIQADGSVLYLSAFAGDDYWKIDYWDLFD